MSYRTMSIRIDKDDYDFVKGLAREEKEDLSSAVRSLLDKGRVHLAIEEYKAGRASLGKASHLAGLSISETMDILDEYGVKSNLDTEDYLAAVKNLKSVY
jgi:predicted HTH domain antitoxin